MKQWLGLVKEQLDILNSFFYFIGLNTWSAFDKGKKRKQGKIKLKNRGASIDFVFGNYEDRAVYTKCAQKSM